MKKNNKKGFTLAELLIVVAIIAVLVAVAIPVFNSQLHKARVNATLANMRAAYAEATVEALDKNTTTDINKTFDSVVDSLTADEVKPLPFAVTGLDKISAKDGVGITFSFTTAAGSTTTTVSATITG